MRAACARSIHAKNPSVSARFPHGSSTRATHGDSTTSVWRRLGTARRRAAEDEDDVQPRRPVLPCGPDGGLRYVGGETRVLVVPREVSFRELAAKLGEVAGPGKIVAAVRYRLVVDGDDVLVSVTCNEELAHMRDEHDRLKATRPSATFRVFFTGVERRPASGLPPLAPKMRRVQSEHALPARNYCGVHPRPAGPAPMRRVQSAHQITGSSRFRPCCYDRRNQCYCSCHLRRNLHPFAFAPPMCRLLVQERIWCEPG